MTFVSNHPQRDVCVLFLTVGQAPTWVVSQSQFSVGALDLVCIRRLLDPQYFVRVDACWQLVFDVFYLARHSCDERAAGKRKKVTRSELMFKEMWM